MDDAGPTTPNSTASLSLRLLIVVRGAAGGSQLGRVEAGTQDTILYVKGNNLLISDKK